MSEHGRISSIKLNYVNENVQKGEQNLKRNLNRSEWVHLFASSLNKTLFSSKQNSFLSWMLCGETNGNMNRVSSVCKQIGIDGKEAELEQVKRNTIGRINELLTQANALVRSIMAYWKAGRFSSATNGHRNQFRTI